MSELLHKCVPMPFSHSGTATVRAIGNAGDFPLPPGMPNVELSLHRTRMRITEHEALRLGEALIAAAQALEENRKLRLAQ